ncbi:MAG: fumarate hydratase [Massilimicrobiota sp.]|jgi:fumarate hydratase subunit alpha|uniref:fumarate hydratase n=1 Tax=Massilimicrobiota sp. An134 TaxID=1965557 RepID=UPI000B37A8F6|nr:fumarate hydratase [Massilimicrobiota sp. An134]MEE0777841.1 fumarate hydratase [Massilimicrobiota sp.]OUQ30196.1 fumarate hydratase [Massilimicrobiota sp. An134]
MREIKQEDIIQAVKTLCIEANYQLPQDVRNAIDQASQIEDGQLAKQTLSILKENAKMAQSLSVPICQDTGMACLFVEIGQDVHVQGSLQDALQEGVRQGYQEGYLRKSVVDDPVFDRINTKDNTPALIHYEIVEGDKLKIIVAPKGFGSENMSQVKMLKPSDGVEGIKDFVLKVVEEAGPNACPPMVIGVGIGGSFDYVTYLAKKAMLRDIGTHHSDLRYQQLEEELLEKINQLGIGPAGYGGKTTALSLNIETYPTHIAGMPVAVSICCHVARHKEVIL